MIAAALALALAAAPSIQSEGPGAAPLAQAAANAWASIEARALGAGLGVTEPAPFRIRAGADLPAGRAGDSVPGLVSLRALAPDHLASALRHEVAHQFLWQACPPARADELFHEAFALWASGEIESWNEGHPHLGLRAAREALAGARRLDTARARRALSRLLAAEEGAPGALPAVLARRVARCEAGARWAPLDAAEFGVRAAVDALVAVSRHSGEVLLSEGEPDRPLAFGSTLKPFLVAGASSTPRLRPGRGPDWSCGETTGSMDAAHALARSCNGWFLDWLARDPSAARFGAWGPVLRSLSLPRLPRDGEEATGLSTALTMNPTGIARAYRLLAEARPDLLASLRQTAVMGTLSGLAESPALRRFALKTGTVRDADGSPRLGWIVAVDDDLVWVMVRAGRAPRQFGGEFLKAVERAPVGREAATVQVFALTGAAEVEARCDAAGFSLSAGRPSPIPVSPVRLDRLLGKGSALCLGAPWRLRVARSAPREYAGVVSTATRANTALAKERHVRARAGSTIHFRTTRLAYMAGVLEAEDASITGEPRVALARVVDHNGRSGRHGGQPCDTTHCQVFLGTARPRSEERRALASAPFAPGRWLAFSRGGRERWREERGAREVEQILGHGARALTFEAGAVRYAVTVDGAAGFWEEARSVPCEVLRGPLRLPACPEEARRVGTNWVLSGRGQGHGEGMEIERAKAGGLEAEAILRAAYPEAVAP